MNELARRVASLSLQRSTKLPTVATHRTLSSLGIARNIPTTDTRKVRFDSAWSVGALPQSLTILKTQFSTNALANGTANSIVADEKSGKNYGVLLDTRNLPKLRPGIIQKRLANCKTYIGRELAIRQSPWKLNRVCQLASGLTLDEAVTQLRFCNIKNADLVAKVLKRTSNLADIRDGLQMSQLEVAECYTNKAMMLKRNMPMGRGRSGVMHHKFSNIRVVLREIDFPLRIYQQKSLNQKKKWLMHQQRAEQDATVAKSKRDEVRRLEKQQEEQLQERKAAQNRR